MLTTVQKRYCFNVRLIVYCKHIYKLFYGSLIFSCRLKCPYDVSVELGAYCLQSEFGFFCYRFCLLTFFVILSFAYISSCFAWKQVNLGIVTHWNTLLYWYRSFVFHPNNRRLWRPTSIANGPSVGKPTSGSEYVSSPPKWCVLAAVTLCSLCIII